MPPDIARRKFLPLLSAIAALTGPTLKESYRKPLVFEVHNVQAAALHHGKLKLAGGDIEHLDAARLARIDRGRAHLRDVFILFTRRNKSCLPYSFPLNVAIYAHSFNLSILCSSHSGCGRFVQIIAFPFSKCNRPALMFSALERMIFQAAAPGRFCLGKCNKKRGGHPMQKQIKLREPAWDIRRKRQSEKNIAS